MSNLTYQQENLFLEDVLLSNIAAKFGTPTYVYSKKAILDAWNTFDSSFQNEPHKICYAVKANSNLHILKVLSDIGSYFDVVSLGELKRVEAATGSIKGCVFSGVGKSFDAISYAIENDVHCINFESEQELYNIAKAANTLKKVVSICPRINPNIDAKTHPYIATGLKSNKFGISIEDLYRVTQFILKNNYLSLQGISCHIGSQISDVSPYKEAAKFMSETANKLNGMGVKIKFINMGGGFGIKYNADDIPDKSEFIATISNEIQQCLTKPSIYIEPGRSIVGSAGIILSKVEYIKSNGEHRFAIIDAGMNDCIRPSLYQAIHNIKPLKDNSKSDKASQSVSIVGPICESSDTFMSQYNKPINEGDILAICDAGAYCSSMGSNYNSRPLPAEVMVDGDKFYIIRSKQPVADLFKYETLF